MVGTRGEQASFNGNGSQVLPVVPYNGFQGEKSKTRVSTFKQGECSAGLICTTRARLNLFKKQQVALLGFSGKQKKSLCCNVRL